MTFTPSIVALLLANAIPLIGVVALGWSAAPVLALYWFETAIIGVFTLAKMVVIPGSLGEKLFLIPFFCVHFGMFMMVHGFFVAMITLAGVHSPIDGVERLADQAFGEATAMLFAVIAMIGSHGVSFVTNFLRTERGQRSIQQTMMMPYPRVIVMHVAILVGTAAAMFLGSPMIAVLLLVVLKTGLDLAAHRKEHKI